MYNMSIIYNHEKYPIQNLVQSFLKVLSKNETLTSNKDRNSVLRFSKFSSPPILFNVDVTLCNYTNFGKILNLLQYTGQKKNSNVKQ